MCECVVGVEERRIITGGNGEERERERGEERETVEGVGGGAYDGAVGAEGLGEQLSDLVSFHVTDSMRTLAL